VKDGFVKVAAITPELRVADVDYNCGKICEYMDEADKAGIKVSVFPELCITGYTCQDLFLQDELLENSRKCLLEIASFSEGLDGLFFVGLPFAVEGKLYNVAAAVSRGMILGMVPKIYLPNYNEFYEARHFCSGKDIDTEVLIDGQYIPFKSNIIFNCNEMPQLRISAEICEDLWVPNPPSIEHCMAGANLIVNLSASNEMTGKSKYRKSLVSGQSGRLVCAYLYTSAGATESTQDIVFSGHNIIAENGTILAESKLFTEGITSAVLDLKRIETERRRMTTYEPGLNDFYEKVPFSIDFCETPLERFIDSKPFVPSNKSERDSRCEEIIMIQAMGLKKRLQHIGCKNAIIGISGGLDSTLAMMVTVRAFDLLGLERKGIIAVTMPGFGTTGRTYDNSVNLIKSIGAELKEISIIDAVNVHFKDIDHDPLVHDVTYENSQARERTQLLMDLANKYNGIVIGTGDLSELALGWATYNGDHMSMYAVNASVPKTLVRHLVRYFADTCEDKLLEATLNDVLDTPVSPELLPPEKGQISQITEDLVGPYELHDFFLYQVLRCGSSPSKIYRMAKKAFGDSYDTSVILKREKTFYKRFFAQHFKRSCLPDGPKVGSVAVSPRGDLRMPTDACAALWLKELDGLE